MSRQAYPVYKQPGVSWLGDIPEHWNPVRLRYQAKTNPSRSELNGLPNTLDVSFVPMESVQEYGGLSLEQTRILAEVSTGYTYFRDGDVLAAKITPCFENGKGSIAKDLMNGIGFGTTELHVLRSHPSIDRHFLFYVTISHAFRHLGAAEMYGAGGQKRVPEDFIKNFRQPIPPINEQQAIATFLDRETARIDALIEKKQRQIELLQEKRSALISHAVTKGLDPNAKMKDSGIEWLGKIPAHWLMVPLRWYFRIGSGSFLSNADFFTEETESIQIPVIGGNGVMGYTDRSNIRYKTLAIGRVRVYCGNVHLVTPPAWVTDNALVLSGIRGFNLRFLAYSLRTANLNRLAKQNTQPLVTGTMVKDQALPLPPEKEQKQIIRFIDTELMRIDSLASKVQYSITMLREYRISLISAAVTGRIDIRKEVP